MTKIGINYKKLLIAFQNIVSHFCDTKVVLVKNKTYRNRPAYIIPENEIWIPKFIHNTGDIDNDLMRYFIDLLHEIYHAKYYKLHDEKADKWAFKKWYYYKKNQEKFKKLITTKGKYWKNFIKKHKK